MLTAPVADGVRRDTLRSRYLCIKPVIHLRHILSVDLHIAVQILHRILRMGICPLLFRFIGDNTSLHSVIFLLRPPDRNDPLSVSIILVARERKADLPLFPVQYHLFPADGNINTSFPASGILFNESVPNLLIRFLRHQLPCIRIITRGKFIKSLAEIITDLFSTIKAR